MYAPGTQRGVNDVWEVEDHTAHKNGQNVGYLTLTLGGKRVCDFFPYAVGANPDWIFEQAHKLAEYGNKCRNKKQVKIAAATVLKHVRGTETMALVGTYKCHQVVSAVLLSEWSRIKFVLESIGEA